MVTLGLYWDINEVLSYNALFNLIYGIRGFGKTYGCKQYAIKDFLKNKNQFLYLRRYDSEFSENKNFFLKMIPHFSDHEFSVDGYEYKIDGEVCGYSKCLSTSKKQKSNEYPYVDKIIFDEFLITGTTERYLPDEITLFYNIYETVARGRDIQVFFLGNSLYQVNPYFLEFNIHPGPMGKIICHNDILSQNAGSLEFIEARKNSRFGKIVRGSRYESSSIDGDFYDTSNNFIAKKTGKCKFICNIKINNRIYGIWQNDYLYVSKDIQRNNITYCFKLSDHDNNTIMADRLKKSPILSLVCKCYINNDLRFESPVMETDIREIMKLYYRR